MSSFVFAPPAPVSLPIAQSTQRFALRRVFCIGRNYGWAAPADGTPAADREPPVFFMKPNDAVVPAEGVVPYPPETEEFCHEIEFVVAIGRAGQRIAPASAADHIFGYAAGLDLTRRDQQKVARAQGLPWEGSKAFDASAPCSAIVPAAAIGHPQRGAVWLEVNGEARQKADVADLIWGVPDLVSRVSHSVALQPGDLIFTGTPAGVAALLPGDVVRAGVEGVATFELTIGPRPAA
ncbi:fumarylacetoacetate hydrolase family protein [Xylophilus sp.]|uniref:fumarylacetoacetate hydrolase family protein n=1 Tax=Xylophilus sp. TaxID=2653893 RepID=UPI0013B98352|nr:fumarylacetoacetate hydrolase family protein [Xylophilus sp.]KAF1048787.1 MAG: Fumarylpyruvate hydrolase [Xylophilus sp.]